MPIEAVFINADPSGFVGSMNWYAYATGNPIMYVDPSGLASALSHATKGGRKIEVGTGSEYARLTFDTVATLASSTVMFLPNTVLVTIPIAAVSGSVSAGISYSEGGLLGASVSGGGAVADVASIIPGAPGNAVRIAKVVATSADATTVASIYNLAVGEAPSAQERNAIGGLDILEPIRRSQILQTKEKI